jgi:hypothetical protein
MGRTRAHARSSCGEREPVSPLSAVLGRGVTRWVVQGPFLTSHQDVARRATRFIEYPKCWEICLGEDTRGKLTCINHLSPPQSLPLRYPNGRLQGQEVVPS